MQLILAGMGSLFDCPSSWPSDERERELRNGRQWLFAIRSYCKFMNGVRCVQDVLYAPVESLQLVLPALAPIDCFTEAERRLAVLSRSVLVDRLMAASPLYTDRRLLSFLPKMKLARMLARALDEKAGQPERRRA
jgi:hypothetical protein